LINGRRASATTAFVTGRFAICISRPTAAFSAVATKHRVYQRVGTTDTGLNGNSVGRTIQTASAAFHTGIAILYNYFFTIHTEHFMRANIEAHSAAGAFVLVQLQRDNVLQINRIFHFT
jgi:hypothetical protein